MMAELNIEKSRKLYENALGLMPGGVNSPVRACKNVGRTPLFIESAKGSTVTDADGNTYIDYICSWGPNILGAADDEVIAAVTETARRGLTFGACHRGEVELAKAIKRNYPNMELLRLVNSGTEAVMSAVRAARGYYSTQGRSRDKIIKFVGCYHGHSDGLLVKAGSGLMTNSVPDSGGVPAGAARDTLLAEYNSLSSVKALFESCPEDIAAVIVEPCAANMGVVPPEEGFLQGLRDLTESYGALLIFDEVITGFRLALGGAAERYGVRPDMTVLGKIVGGGMPLAAYGGCGDIMECVSPLGSVYQAGTLSGNPVAVAAGLATVRRLESDPGIYDRLEKSSAALEKAMRSAGLNVNRQGSIMTPFFTDRPVRDYSGAVSCDTGAYAEYYGYMLRNGIYIAPSQFEAMFVSAAHTDEDIARTAQVIKGYAQNFI